MNKISDIKIKQKADILIKKLNRATIYIDKLKNNIINIKNTCNYDETNENITDKAVRNSNQNIEKSSKILEKYGSNSIPLFNKNLNKIKELNVKTSEIRIANTRLKNIRKIRNENTIKNTENIKLKINSNIQKIKKDKAIKSKQINYNKFQAKKRKIKKTIKNIKILIMQMKLASKASITFLIMGGYVSIIIIIIIALIGAFCSSSYGIFFTNENVNSSISMNEVISDINKEFILKITEIQKNNTYDEYEITSERTSWKDVLAVYSVYINGENKEEVITLNNVKIKILKEIFWEMNKITHTIKTKDEKIILSIKIKGKSVRQMATRYQFTDKQIELLNEMNNDKYMELWNDVIYGKIDNNDLIKVAIAQIGNIGGQPYWSWYGFNERVEWCACFVSWCANECGYMEKGIIPKFAGCQSEGVTWFKACNLWKDSSYIPNPGDIIFFDWDGDKKSDHVGIVEKVENDKVHTIEGNSNDMCKMKNYNINSSVILGYGLIKN